ncbi:Ig-like domain-containing protein, partial [uncultured Shewanella sp.]|uniref:Ig-like domain-containing protein n=1 Tax=uncultured Shewanella sp. TaxID=173975 RepID=UPI0026293F56
MTSFAKCLIFFLSIFMLSACDSSDADRDDITSLALTPSTAYINLNGTQAYTLVATYSDSSTSTVTDFATWSSSDTSIATVESGIATGVSSGNVTITASLNGASTTATLYVSDPAPTSLVITPVNQATQQGTQLQYTATLYYDDNTSLDVTDATETVWSSSDTSCTTIQSSGDTTPGLAQALTVTSTCNTTISAIYNNASALTDSTSLYITAVIAESINITPVDDSIANGEELQYTATVTYSDNSTYDATTDTNTTWSSSDTSVATIGEGTGYATSVAQGDTTISVSYSGLINSTSLTVTDATITSLYITPSKAYSPVGLSVQYTATATYTDDTTADVTSNTNLTWESNNTHVAKMNENIKGLADTIAIGQATITAALSDQTADATLIVTSAIPESLVVTPQYWETPQGVAVQYTATMY